MARSRSPSGKPKGPKRPSSALLDLAHLLIKIGLICVIGWLVIHYVFGVHRYLSSDMVLSMKDGDLIFYFRLDKNYASGDITVMEYMGDPLVARVIAVGGDTVDIDEKGLVINGYHVQEADAVGETLQYEEGVTFPISLMNGQIFVLGDNREHSTDSRVFGAVNANDTFGKVIGLLRRRSL